MQIRRLVTVIVSCLVLMCAAGCKEEGSVEVKSFTFEGNRAVSAKQLKSILATGASSKLPFGKKRYFNRQQFEADLKRIVAFYRDRGYPDARVSSFDVKLSDDQKAVKIAIRIAEGEPIRVERIQFEGFDPLPPEHRRSLETALPLKSGNPLDRALVQASREAALDEFRDHGFPHASVRIGEEPGSSERLRVIVLRAEAGALTRIGPITINGIRTVSENVVRRQLLFKTGDLFQQSKLQESQRRLYSQELFEFANIEPVRGEDKPPEVPVRVTVTEGKHQKVNFSVGYGSEEKARGEIDWRHVNFLGGARTAGVLARYSGFDRGVRLNFIQPYVFSPRYSATVTGQSWFTDHPAFDLNTSGGRVTLTRQFGRSGGPVLRTRPSTSLAVTYAHEWEDYTISNEALRDLTFRDELIALGLDPRTGRGSGTLAALSLDGGRNTTDNLLDAKRGYLAAVHLEQAGKFLGGTFDYYEITGEGRYYQSIVGRAVLAVQGKAGSIDAFGIQDQGVPFFKRYFLGGATNLRGWGRFDVSPLSGAGLPIGGASFVNMSAELRAPIWGSLGGVLFVDAGNVWTNPWDFNLNDLRYDVGPGLRYQTPIGPFRIDLGYQLNPIPGLLVNGKSESRRFRIHFSIGQAF
jgi:outer membrane protein assembly complex protein YaeT